jgi:RimJ/RimL family protein N-acetyltransferase
MTTSGEWKGFVIARADTGEYLGQIDFVNLDLKNGWGELGMVIGSEENHGRGYGTEALELFLTFAFQELRLNRVELVCWAYNTRARRVYEKVGFVQEGVRRQKRFRFGTYHDVICYGLLKSEWEARRSEPI